MPFFSVVIPLYNKENFIAQTLSHVLSQRFQDFEVVIVNDGSTDKSLQVVQSFDDERIKIYQQKNQGVSAARNFGIQQATGQYMALLDADDIWKNYHLQALYDAIQQYPDKGVYCTGYEIMLDKKGTIRPAVYNNYSPNDIEIVDDFFTKSTVNPILCSSVLAFTKDVFTVIGDFDTTLKASEDLDFFLRAATKFNIVLNPRISVCYVKDSENNLSKGQYNSDSEIFLNRYKNIENNYHGLKKYLDVQRYSFVIRCKLVKNSRWQVLKKDIDSQNLTFKQRILLQCPAVILRKLKSFHRFLIKNNIYISAFR